VALGLVLILVGVVGLALASTRGDTESSTFTFDGISVLTFDVANSPISLTAGGEEAVVEVSATTGFLGGDVTVEQVGETLEIVQECPLVVGWGCRASFDVTVPAEVAVDGSTSNGSITVTALDGPISVATSNGPITFDGIASTVNARTSNGRIDATSVASEVFEASTSNGRVALEFDEPPSLVRVTTSNGAIEIVLPSDSPPYAVEASTSNGSIVTDVRTDPAAAGWIFARTSNGDVTVSYRD
jgi:hypothetical protein